MGQGQVLATRDGAGEFAIAARAGESRAPSVRGKFFFLGEEKLASSPALGAGSAVLTWRPGYGTPQGRGI